MNDALGWALILICLFLSFFFSLAETSLSLCNRFRIQVQADEGSKVSKMTLHLLNKYDQSLALSLLGNNAVAFAISSISTILFVKYFTGTPLQDWASLISTIIVTIIVFIFGDLLAKTIGKTVPDTMSTFVTVPMTILFYISWPITILFELLIRLFQKITKGNNDDDLITEDQLGEIVEDISTKGMIEEEQGEIIQSALDFDDTRVKEVLTKKEDMFMISTHDLSHKKIHELLETTTYSRIPVYSHDKDNIIGIFIVKTYLTNYAQDESFQIRKSLQKPYIISQNTMIDDLFNGFKKHHTHVAIVKDKDELIGMVTMEDVLEELVNGIGEKNLLKRGTK